MPRVVARAFEFGKRAVEGRGKKKVWLTEARVRLSALEGFPSCKNTRKKLTFRAENVNRCFGRKLTRLHCIEIRRYDSPF